MRLTVTSLRRHSYHRPNAPAPRVICVGDSITSTQQPAADPTKNWSIQLAALIAARQPTPLTLFQRGFPGNSYQYVWASSPNQTSISADGPITIDPMASANAVLCIFAGTNGLVLGGNTPAVEAGYADAYLAARIAAGFSPANIYVLGMLPRETYSERLRAEYNSRLEGYALARGCRFVDINNNADVGYAGQQNDLNWYPSDKIHPLAVGHEAIAESVYDAIYPETWTPSLLASRRGVPLALWMDGLDATTTFADTAGTTPATSSVALWRDKSGNGRHFSQATAGNRPSLGTINGQRALTFAMASTQYLAATGLTGMPSTNMTAAVVAPVTSGYNELYLDLSTDGAASNHLTIRGQSGLFQLANTTGVSYPSNTVQAAAVCAAFPSGHALINGARQVSYTGTLPATAPVAARIGAGFNNGFKNQGPIGEVILFAGKLTYVDQARLTRYLTDRWATGDTIADDVAFTPVTGATTSTAYTSNTVTISGLSANAQTRISVSGTNAPQMSINGGAFSSGAVMVANGDTIAVKSTSPSTAGTEVLSEVRLGPKRYYWSVKT